MRRKRLWLFPALLATFFLVGCATFRGSAANTTEVPKLTLLEMAKLKSLDFQERYAAQLKDAVQMGKMAVANKLSPGQLEVYRVKRALLIKVEPLIKAFDNLVSEGVVPSVKEETDINGVLNAVAAAALSSGDLRERLKRISAECAKRTNEKFAAEIAALTGRQTWTRW